MVKAPGPGTGQAPCRCPTLVIQSAVVALSALAEASLVTITGSLLVPVEPLPCSAGEVAVESSLPSVCLRICL
jgi:hypothetical protein